MFNLPSPAAELPHRPFVALQVLEVTYDGQEVLQAPPTPAEHLARQAAKIDFGAGVGVAGVGDDEDDDEDDAAMEEDGDREEGEDDGEATNTTKTAQVVITDKVIIMIVQKHGLRKSVFRRFGGFLKASC